MSQDLFAQYVEAGIVQFGRFQQPDGAFHPISFNFLLLPSFPQLMGATARALTPLLMGANTNRLLATRAAIPLGAVLAVESGIPLTYPYGEAKSYTAAYVIEGAYDVGHPTTLLTYTLTAADDAHQLLEPARRVGLHVHHVLCLTALDKSSLTQLTAQGITVQPLMADLKRNLIALEAQGKLTSQLRQYIVAWLNGSV